MQSNNSSLNGFFLLVLSCCLALACGDIWDLSGYEALGVGIFSYFLIRIIKNLGKTIWVFLDVISLLLALTCLVAPLFFYHHFTETNDLAVLWVKFMPVSSDEYYGFTIPASLALILGFNIGFIRRKELRYSIQEYVRLGLLSRPAKLGFQLVLISLVMGFVRSIAPGSLGFIVFLSTKLIFIGFLYLYFSGRKPSVKWVFIAIGLLFFQSLQAAMFGELIFMILLAVIIFTYGKRYSISFKAGVIAAGIAAIILIQSIKLDYRKVVWADTGSGGVANIALFANLASQKTQDAGTFFSEEKMFFTAVRFNQGWLVASVMKNVPAIVPYANGETIWQSLLASIAPRFLWPDKPEAGGKANIKRFLGWDLEGTSMNIGLLGESYANFGIWAGCIFLFFYGLAFQWAYNFCIKLTYTHPTLILWLPLLFFYCIGVENDVLTVVNHLTKTGLFVYLLYKLYPKIFRINL